MRFILSDRNCSIAGLKRESLTLPENPRKPWWQNSRGELFVIAQFILFGLIIWGPPTLPFLPVWSTPAQYIAHPAGILLMAGGAAFALAGTFNLGRNLTPFICPKAQSVLLEQGAFRFIRHPIYSGLLQLACGWALWIHGWLTLACTILLFIILDAKARREEKILRQTFPGYAAYAGRVRRLIPFIY
jgi:protein-S-isoprenylcysteine O-methyltransferase Ste14